MEYKLNSILYKEGKFFLDFVWRNCIGGEIPKLSGNENGLQFQNCCLDVYVITCWNQKVAVNFNSCLDVQTVENCIF
jgi:hypothetical protein